MTAWAYVYATIGLFSLVSMGFAFRDEPKAPLASLAGRFGLFLLSLTLFSSELGMLDGHTPLRSMMSIIGCVLLGGGNYVRRRRTGSVL